MNNFAAFAEVCDGALNDMKMFTLKDCQWILGHIFVCLSTRKYFKTPYVQFLSVFSKYLRVLRLKRVRLHKIGKLAPYSHYAYIFKMTLCGCFVRYSSGIF